MGAESLQHGAQKSEDVRAFPEGEHHRMCNRIKSLIPELRLDTKLKLGTTTTRDNEYIAIIDYYSDWYFFPCFAHERILSTKT